MQRRLLSAKGLQILATGLDRRVHVQRVRFASVSDARIFAQRLLRAGRAIEMRALLKDVVPLASMDLTDAELSEQFAIALHRSAIVVAAPRAWPNRVAPMSERETVEEAIAPATVERFGFVGDIDVDEAPLLDTGLTILDVPTAEAAGTIEDELPVVEPSGTFDDVSYCECGGTIEEIFVGETQVVIEAPPIPEDEAA